MIDIIKKHYILFSLFFAMFLVLIGILIGIYIVKMKEKSKEWSLKKDIVISNIKTFHFSYSTGTAINSNVRYDVKYQNDKYYTMTPNPEQGKSAMTRSACSTISSSNCKAS